MFCFGKFISHLSYHICMFICLGLLLVLFSFTVDNCNIWLLPFLLFACSTLCTWYILDSFFLQQPGLVCLITSVFKLILLAKLSLRASNQLLFLILFTLNRASEPLLTFFWIFRCRFLDANRGEADSSYAVEVSAVSSKTGYQFFRHWSQRHQYYFPYFKWCNSSTRCNRWQGN